MPVAVLVAVPAVAPAAPIATLLPTGRLPLAVGGYVIGFTAVAGAAMLGWRRPIREPLRPVPAAPVLIGYAAVTIAVPLQLGVTWAVPTGARWWLLPLVWAGFALLAYGAERLRGGNSLGVSAVVVSGLTGAAAAGLTYGFVLLVVPLLAVLLLWQSIWSAVLHRFGVPSWLIALVGSLVVAWPIAAALPVTA